MQGAVPLSCMKQRVPRSVAERWAVAVLRVVRADGDPRTIGAWARSIAVSRSVLCEYCRLVHVTPRDARDFARLLRVVCRSAGVWHPEEFLDVADTRTLTKLLIRGGLTATEVTPTPEEFLTRQRLVPAHNVGLTALRALFEGGEIQP